MSLFSRSAVFAALALAACGGSSSSSAPDIKTFFPASNEVVGWTQVAAKPLQVGVGATGASDLVDGAADPFITQGLVQLAMASYDKGNDVLDLRVWQMKDAASAASVYTALLGNSLYSANTWGTCPTAIGSDCRIADTGGHWWVNTRKGAYHVEALIAPKDASTDDDAIAFLQAVLAKIP
jgi:hypothetical protein